MKKVIFVCTGNTCRSPMAEIIFKNKLKKNNITNIIVSSAGIMVNEGEFTNQKSIVALKNMGLSIAKRKAKQLKKSLVNKNTVLITMTKSQKEYIKNLPDVYSFSDFYSGIDIPDPYGLNQEEYDKCAKIIAFVLDEVLEKIMENKL